MMLLTGAIQKRRIVPIVFIFVFLASLTFPLCTALGPSLVLNPVTHDLTPLGRNGNFSSEVVIDKLHISGTTAPDAKISVKKTMFGAANESSIPVSSNGSFSTTVQFEIGPGFVQGVERGAVKVQVVATLDKTNKTLDVPLNQTASNAALNVVGAGLSAGTSGYPHTLVVYDNPWLFYSGQYVDDNGTSVQSTTDAVAAQLAKFSVVSLHYTDEASNIALIKQKNPNTKVFAYINPVFCYKSTDPNSEWQQVVKNHPDWFLYPTAADRQAKTNPIVEYDGTEQVMDLTTGWQAEVVSLSKAALAKGFDGLYIDCVCDDPSLCYGYGESTAPVGDWHTALNTYMTQVQVDGKQNFYNGQSPVMVSSNQDFLDRTDGWMDEGFISYKGWQLSAIDMPQYASDQDKFTMFYAVNPSTAVRHFYFASALLSDGYFFYAPASTQWFAEYGTHIGDPTGEAYQLQGFSGVYARNYTEAKVIVNPTAAAVTVNMPGYVDSNGTSASKITINANDGVILKSSAGVWGAWASMSGQLSASPAAVSWGDGHIDVFARGTDNALWWRNTSNGGTSWSSWTSLGGQLATTTGPAASSQRAGQLDVFAIGSDKALWHRSYTSGKWSTWESLGGQLTASPGAVSWADGRIDVFARGSDNALWHRSYNSSTWSTWESLGGQVAATTGPAASSQREGQLDVFVIGSNQALWHRSYA